MQSDVLGRQGLPLDNNRYFAYRLTPIDKLSAKNLALKKAGLAETFTYPRVKFLLNILDKASWKSINRDLFEYLNSKPARRRLYHHPWNAPTNLEYARLTQKPLVFFNPMTIDDIFVPSRGYTILPGQNGMSIIKKLEDLQAVTPEQLQETLTLSKADYKNTNHSDWRNQAVANDPSWYLKHLTACDMLRVLPPASNIVYYVTQLKAALVKHLRVGLDSVNTTANQYLLGLQAARNLGKILDHAD